MIATVAGSDFVSKGDGVVVEFVKNPANCQTATSVPSEDLRPVQSRFSDGPRRGTVG